MTQIAVHLDSHDDVDAVSIYERSIEMRGAMSTSRARRCLLNTYVRSRQLNRENIPMYCLWLIRVSLLALILVSVAACGMQRSGMGSYPAPQLGIVTDATLTIVDIEPGSAAEQASLRQGDRLIAVNGHTLASVAAFGEQVQTLQPMQELHLTLQRAGREQDVTLRVIIPAGRSNSSTPTPVPANEYYF